MRKAVTVVLVTFDGRRARLKAMLHSGSFHTIVREGALPKGTAVARYPSPRPLGTAGGKIRVVGVIVIDLEIAGKLIETAALVCPELSRDLIIGAGTMRPWGISIANRNGRTRVVVARDMRDPDLTAIDSAY